MGEKDSPTTLDIIVELKVALRCLRFEIWSWTLSVTRSIAFTQRVLYDAAQINQNQTKSQELEQ